MMYRHIVCALMILFAVTAVNAGERKVAAIGFNMGFLEAPEYVKDFWKGGPGGSVSYGTTLLPELTVLGMIEAYTFPFDETGIIRMSHQPTDSIRVVGSNASALAGLVMLKMNIMPPEPGVSPYVVAGIGLAHVDIPWANIKYESEDSSRVYPGTKGVGGAISFGAGIDAYITLDLGLFAEIRYMKIFSDPLDIEYLPVRIGVTYGF